MTPTLVDRTGAASRAAAEGQFALATGNTHLARQKYAEAAGVLEREATAARLSANIHLLRFLAASNHFYGGQYASALKVARRVEERHLPNRVRHLFPSFLSEARRRAKPDYAARVRQSMWGQLASGRYADILETLKRHPFVLDPVGLAFLRASACDHLGEYEASSRFYKLALGYRPNDPGLLCSSAAELFRQAEGGNSTALEACLSHRLEHIPHVLIHAAACMVRFLLAKRGWAVKVDLPEVVGHADKTWEFYQKLPSPAASDPQVRRAVLVALSTARLAAHRLGKTDQAAELAERAVVVDPDDSFALIGRGVERYPAEQAVKDFRKAAQNGASSHVPFTFLAQEAMHRHAYREAVPYIEAALSLAPADKVRAALTAWLAICADMLVDKSRDPDALFRRAVELDPANLAIAANYQEYKHHARGWQLDQAVAGNVRGAADSLIEEWNRQVTEAQALDKRRDQKAQQLLLAAA